MATMRAVQIDRPGGEFQPVEREIPEPQTGQVRIKVQACGICYSDRYVKDGLNPAIKYPRIPGHEIAGTIDKIGPGVTGWKIGDRAGVGWHGGHCFECQPCRHGDFINCQNSKTTAITHDGGYAEYMISPQDALARIPSELRPVEAAPLLCAGITTYNALRNSRARAGDLVAIQGIGGLGHLAVQFASKMGFRTVAISRGRGKEALARSLGASEFVDAGTVNVAESLLQMGGARVVVATAPNSGGIGSLLSGLAVNGQLILLAGTGEPFTLTPTQLVRGRKSIQGWASGHAGDWEDTLNFCVLRGVHPVIETIPLEQAAYAYERMMTNQARFRMVLEIGE